MKISKLFHCLYAVIMLLPIFAIGVTCITCFWNKEITADNEVAEINYKYRTNEIENEFSFVQGNLYTLTINEVVTTEQNISYIKSALNLKNLNGDFSLDCNTLDNTEYLKIQLTRSVINFRNQSNSLVYQLNNSQITFPYSFDVVMYNYVAGSEIDYRNYSASTYNEIESVNIVSDTSTFDTKNVFYYSIDKVQESSLFNWAYNSFLVTPFAYIVSLFSMPQNSFIVMLLSYWLAISIIWLVFDLIMYVPLLVHRWIDKGVLE